MTDDGDFKKIVRDRAAKTGESYQAARRQLEPAFRGSTTWRANGSGGGSATSQMRTA